MPDPNAPDIGGSQPPGFDPAILQQMLAQPSPQPGPPPPITGPGPNLPPAQTPQAMPPPDTTGGTPQVPQMAPDLGSGQSQQQGPPRMGAPILATFLHKMFTGGGYAPGPPGQPGRPLSRLDAFESFLGDFMGAFSAGMAGGGTGPGANVRAAGIAMQAPYQRAVGQYQAGQEQQQLQAQQQLRESQSAEAAARGEYYKSQAEATRRASEYVPVQIPDGQGGFTTIQLPAKNAQGIYQRIISGDTARDVAGTRAGATTEAAATRAGAQLGAAQLGKEGRIGAAQIGAQSRITVEGLRDNRMLQAAAFNLAGRNAQTQYNKTMDGIKSWAQGEQRTLYLNYGSDPQKASAAFQADYQQRVDAANKILVDDVNPKVGSALPGGKQGTAAVPATGATQPIPGPTGPPATFPIKATPAPSPQASQANKERNFTNTIQGMGKNDPTTAARLQNAKKEMDKLNPSDRAGWLNSVSSGVLSDGNKALLRNLYGLNK